MDGEALKILLKYQGNYNFFCQDKYIRNNGWANVDSRTRKGAWIGNQYNEKGQVTAYGLEGGVCVGLGVAYLISGNEWETFNAYMMSDRGKSVIRGTANLQMLTQHSAVPSPEGWHTVLNVNHVRFVKEFDISFDLFTANPRQALWRELTPEVGYLILAYGRTCGHVLSMRLRQGTITLFDPNSGEYSFPYKNGRSPGMESFLSYFTTVLYTRFTLFLAEKYVLSRY